MESHLNYFQMPRSEELFKNSLVSKNSDEDSSLDYKPKENNFFVFDRMPNLNEEFSHYQIFNSFIKNENDYQNSLSTKQTIPLKQNPYNEQKIDNNNLEIIISKSETKEKKPKRLLGRKRKNDKRFVKHTKLGDDNKIRKIKTYFMNFVFELLNASLSPGHKKFLKLNKKVNENLKKEENLAIMKMTFKEIYLNNPINGRYNDFKKENNINQKLIKEIYEKKVETATIKLLDSKFIDLLELLRTQYIDVFYSDILKKEKKNYGNFEEAVQYVDELKELLFQYEKWFEKKAGRAKEKD